jgi:isopenicillin N synthase-like dioxygenase
MNLLQIFTRLSLTSCQSKEFFASPESEKASIPISADNKGWSGMFSETLDPATQKRGDFKQCVAHQCRFSSGHC